VVKYVKNCPHCGKPLRRNVLTAEQEAEVVRRYLAGERVKVIADAFGRSQKCIFTILSKLDVSPRRIPKHARRRK
jgi:hypothetical protein